LIVLKYNSANRDAAPGPHAQDGIHTYTESACWDGNIPPFESFDNGCSNFATEGVGSSVHSFCVFDSIDPWASTPDQDVNGQLDLEHEDDRPEAARDDIQQIWTYSKLIACAISEAEDRTAHLEQILDWFEENTDMPSEAGDLWQWKQMVQESLAQDEVCTLVIGHRLHS